VLLRGAPAAAAAAAGARRGYGTRARPPPAAAGGAREDKEEEEEEERWLAEGRRGRAAADAGDTIFALSTAPGAAALAVVRISGPGADAALAALWPAGFARGGAPPPPARLRRAALACPTGAPLDDALVARFAAPRSFTGEGLVELHLHGGPAVVAATLAALAALGLRPAAPGEFSKRAFLSGKLDLASAEGLADLLTAETEAQRLQALAAAGGGAAAAARRWAAALTRALAHLEALIDFGEDEEIAADVADAAADAVAAVAAEVAAALGDAWRGMLTRGGVRLALLGPPNTGKSSLLNALAGRPAALVSPLAGTTRDAIEVHLSLAGHKAVLSDSAGVRATADVLEAAGIRRSAEAAAAADALAVVLDASEPRAWAPALAWLAAGLAADAPAAAGAVAATAGPEEGALPPPGARPRPRPLLLVLNKADLLPSPAAVAAAAASASAALASALAAAGAAAELRPPVAVSCATGEGMEALASALAGCVSGVMAPAGGGGRAAPALATRLRHRACLQEAADALARFAALRSHGPGGEELAAEELRAALRALGRLLGAVGTEAVLDVVFADFCVGK